MKKYRGLTAFLVAFTLCISLSACGATETAITDTTATTEVTTVATT